MIIDSSAVVAMVHKEPPWQALALVVARAEHARISAPNYVETCMVVDARGGPAQSRRLDQVLDTLGIEVAAFTPEQAAIARQAFRDFGKGSGHPARLNFGDCIAYATATDLREPLLFVGDDFTHTDIRPALTED